MNFNASSRGSSSPRARRNELFGIQYAPEDFAVVPPVSAAFSSTRTSTPRCATATAAGVRGRTSAHDDDVGHPVEPGHRPPSRDCWANPIIF